MGWRNKNVKQISIVIISLLLGFITPSVAEELEVPLHYQHTIVWCWAATIAMVGGGTSQVRMVKTARCCRHMINF